MSVGGYTIRSNGTVFNSAGSQIGTVNSNGDIVSTSGSILMRGAVSGAQLGGMVSGGSMSTGSMSSGSMGSGSLGGGASIGSAGGFTLLSDGSVRNSSGVIIGRLDRSTGNIVAANGTVVGRMPLPGQ